MIDYLARKRVPLGFAAALVAVVLASPTWGSWRLGLIVAVVGEALRVWAAGHLEKGREVTRSGPYQWTAHPLYVGSSVVALGVVIAAHSVLVAVLVAVYLASTITAAVRTEESFLREKFGAVYEDYRWSKNVVIGRRFSPARAVANHEHRAVIGLAIGFVFLALRLVLPI